MFDTKLVYMLSKVTKFKDIVSRVCVRLRARARVCAPVYPCARVPVYPCVCVCVCARVRVHMCPQKRQKIRQNSPKQTPTPRKKSRFPIAAGCARPL